MKTQSGPACRTFTNPVYKGSFPDPFVLKCCGEYFAFCTGIWTDGRVFGVLRSRDLVDWLEVGGAMEKLDNDSPFYWAPEVTYHNGKFYLYYSVGNETLMELRVAVSDRPDGGYVDSGHKLTTQDFAIDAHVFADDDGSRYLFYATDFLEHTHIGTGTVVDRMIDWFTLAGDPKPVTRARFDWQVYDPARKEKGGVRWHTVEGPFVLKRKGVYYEMFSGGNWQNTTYGVSFATTRDPRAAGEWQQYSDGDKILPILRTLPGEVVGPGHNSVVRGPNNRELYCIYHRWTEEARVLSIDRMDFAGERIFVAGPTSTEQPAPRRPTIEGFGEAWRVEGSWEVGEYVAKCEGGDRNRLTLERTFSYFLCEFGFRIGFGRAGFQVTADDGQTLELAFHGHEAILSLGDTRINLTLPSDFAVEQFHLLRSEWNGSTLTVQTDEIPIISEKLTARSATLTLLAENASAEFAGLTLTEGFEDLFEDESSSWEIMNGVSPPLVRDGEMKLASTGNAVTTAVRGDAHEFFEYAVNIRVGHAGGESFDYGLMLLGEGDKELARISLAGEVGRCFGADENLIGSFRFPENYVAQIHNQFQIRVTSGNIQFALEGQKLFDAPLRIPASRVAAYVSNGTVFIEMARLTVF